MIVKDDSTPETQLEELRTACEGKRWLVVLGMRSLKLTQHAMKFSFADDVWNPEHEKSLNCCSPPCKLLVTTRYVSI